MGIRSWQASNRDMLWRGVVLASLADMGDNLQSSDVVDLKKQIGGLVDSAGARLVRGAHTWPIPVSNDAGWAHLRFDRADRYIMWSRLLLSHSPMWTAGTIRNEPDGSVSAVLAPVSDPVRCRSSDLDTPPEPELRTLVTYDATVETMGLRPELFRHTDYLFRTYGVVQDVTYSRHVAPTGYVNHSGAHFLTTENVPSLSLGPLPDRYVDVRTAWAEGTPEQRAHLTQGDLICAAGALNFGVPLYTAKPASYKFLGLGLKTIAYGKIRNRDIIVGPSRPRGLPTPEFIPRPLHPSELAAATEPEPASPAERALRLLKEGSPFTPAAQDVAAACDSPEDLLRVARTVLDYDGGAEHDWKIGLIEAITTTDPASASQDARDEIRDLLLNATAGARDGFDADRRRVGQAAILAYGEWGVLDDDFRDLLADFDDDESTWIWYPTLLRLKGVPRELVESEMAKVNEGVVTPSIARLNELAARAPSR